MVVTRVAMMVASSVGQKVASSVDLKAAELADLMVVEKAGWLDHLMAALKVDQKDVPMAGL